VLALDAAERAQELVWRSALSLGGLAEVGCDDPDTSELESTQSGDQVGRKSGRRRDHRTLSKA